MEEKLFDELRTKQQLGYDVSCGVRRTHGVLGFSIDVTSSKYGPSELERRVDEFLTGFVKELEEMTEPDAHDYAQSLARRLLKPDSGMFEETRQHWSSIQDGTFSFNERFLVAHFVSKSGAKGLGPGIKPLRAFFKAGFCPGASVSVWVVGGACKVADLKGERTKIQPGVVVLSTPEALHTLAPLRWEKATDQAKGSEEKKRSKRT